MHKSTILLLTLLGILLYSCEYEPNGVYNRTVNQNVTPPHIQTVELNLTDDSVYLYADKEVNFKFISDNQAIRTVRLLIDGRENSRVNSESGTFIINCNQLSEGIHSMEIEVFTGSGTGSIAESLGAEGFISSKSWVLTIDKYYNLDINTTAKNGLLHITWSKYRASDFKEYIIYKHGNFSDDQEIKRTTTTEFIDSTYVGERSWYRIKVNTQNNTIASDYNYFLEADLPKVYFSVEDSNRYTVKWTKSKFYNAVDTFLILQRPEGSYDFENRVKSTRNPSDTMYRVIKAGFGDILYFRLRLVPRRINYQYNTSDHYDYESGTFGILGFPFPNKSFPTNFFQVNKDEFVYINGCDSILRYSVSQKRVVEQLGYKPAGCSMCNFTSMQGSPSGNYLTVYVDCESNVMLANSSNLKNNSIHKLQSITGGFGPQVPVSDIGTGVLRSLNGKGFEMYDFNSSSILGHYENNNYAYNIAPLKISSKGDYFFVRDDSIRLVQFSGSQFKNTWKAPLTNNIKYFDFDPTNQDHVIFWDGTKLSVKLCSNLSTVYSFALTDSYLMNIDYYNKEILTYSSGHLYVRSFINGSLLKDIQVNINPSNWSDNCILINHTIVNRKGLLYFIN